MIEALTFRVQAYWKRPRGEPGMTSMSSVRVSPSNALMFILAEILSCQDDDGSPDAVKIELNGTVATITIDWAALPVSVRNPKIPVRRSRY